MFDGNLAVWIRYMYQVSAVVLVHQMMMIVVMMMIDGAIFGAMF